MRRVNHSLGRLQEYAGKKGGKGRGKGKKGERGGKEIKFNVGEPSNEGLTPTDIY